MMRVIAAAGLPALRPITIQPPASQSPPRQPDTSQYGYRAVRLVDLYFDTSASVQFLSDQAGEDYFAVKFYSSFKF